MTNRSVAPPPSAPPPPACTPPSAFEPYTTPLFTLAWLLVVLQGWGALLEGDPLSWLWDPATSVARVANRDIQVSEAMGASALVLDAHGDRDTEAPADPSLEDAIAMLSEVARRLDAEPPGEGGEGGKEEHDEGGLQRGDAGPLASEILRLQLAILNAEAGDRDEALRLADSTSVCPGFAELLHATSSDPVGARAPESPTTEVEDAQTLECVARTGTDEWLLERLSVRVHARAGRPEAAKEVAHETRSRGRTLLHRSNALEHAKNLVVGAGLITLALLLWRQRKPSSGSPLRHAPPWSLETGLGVAIRGDFWSRLYFVALASTPPVFQESTVGSVLLDWGTPISAIPLVWLIHRHLAPGREALWCFGLAPRAWRVLPLVGITLSAIAIDLLGIDAIGQGLAAIGVGSHWAEGFNEALVFGSAAQLVEQALELLVFSPTLEELLFRGLLYWSLRERLGVAGAAFASATVFGLVHFYTLPGFLMTFWSGLVWTYVFERTHSLAPGIAAHAFYNLLYLLGVVLMYR